MSCYAVNCHFYSPQLLEVDTLLLGRQFLAGYLYHVRLVNPIPTYTSYGCIFTLVLVLGRHNGSNMQKTNKRENKEPVINQSNLGDLLVFSEGRPIIWFG